MSGCYVAFHKQLGDLVLLEPALSKLRDHHGAPIGCMTRTRSCAFASLDAGRPFAARNSSQASASHLYCFDPLNKSAVRSFFSPARLKRCVLPEKREMKWFHPLVFRELIVPELGDRYVAEYFWENTPVAWLRSFSPTLT